jgi:predicted transcriptional regulator
VIRPSFRLILHWKRLLRACSSRCGYTIGMKTAISIPNDLFDGAERLARRTRRSRSRLFSDALREYLARHAPDKITEGMDQALDEIGEGIGEQEDPFVSSAASRTLEQTEW